MAISTDKLSTESNSLPSTSSAGSSSSETSTDSGARSLSSLSDSSSNNNNNHNNTNNTSNTTPTKTKQPTGGIIDNTNNNNGKHFNEYNNDENDDFMDDLEELKRKNEEMLLQALSSEKDKAIHEFVTEHIPNATLVENIGAEMTYSISNKPEFTRSYEKVFRQIEKNMDSIGINSVGISDTTLEEIFIKLAKQPKFSSNKPIDSKFKCLCCSLPLVNLACIKRALCYCCSRPADEEEKKKELTQEQLKQFSAYTKLRVSSHLQLVFQQLYALLIKRFHRVKRNIKGMIMAFI